MCTVVRWSAYFERITHFASPLQDRRADNPSVHHLLAQSLSRLGAWEEAVEARRAAIRTGYSDRSGTWLLLAADYLSMGDTLAAMAARDSAEVRARTDAERTAAREWLAGLCGSSPGGGC
jgi:uncharacterized protein HemY